MAVTKAAGSHYLLIQALAKAGLTFKDITPAYLIPADGRAAFENHKVDAWVTWDPYVASAQRQQNARILVDGSELASYQRYYLVSGDYAKAHPEVLQQVYLALREAGAWTKANPEAAARILGPLWGNLDSATVQQANARRSYDVQPVKLDNLAEQQRIADAFYREGCYPRRWIPARWTCISRLATNIWVLTCDKRFSDLHQMPMRVCADYRLHRTPAAFLKRNGVFRLACSKRPCRK